MAASLSRSASSAAELGRHGERQRRMRAAFEPRHARAAQQAREVRERERFFGCRRSGRTTPAASAPTRRSTRAPMANASGSALWRADGTE